jgi:hypothetical protein
MINKIIIRYFDGKIKKGTTEDFFPNKTIFHLRDKDSDEYTEIRIEDLKAVFFVKSFEGDHTYHESTEFERFGLGRKIKVCFKDGEVLFGYTQGFSRERVGFILFPADPNSNNEKVFVVTAATENINFII